MSVTLVLLPLLFGGSVYVWYQLASRRIRRQPFLDQDVEPRARWNSLPELIVLYVTLLIMIQALWARLHDSPVGEPVLPTRTSIAIQAALNFVLTLALSLTLVSRQRPLSSFGITTSKLGNQVLIGIAAYFAAVLPMAISIVVTAPFRGPESQHLLLKLLTESNDVATIAVIAVLAAFSVPLMEELQYRVVLQGWLESICPAPVAILITAVLFSMVHGWKNGAALLPLALILGYVFHRRHSYVAVVVIHSLYNATMLTLQLLNPQTSP